MITPTIAPPPRTQTPPAPTVRDLPVHVPLRRKPRPEPSGRISLGALLGSVGLHVALVAAGVAFLRFGPGLVVRVTADPEPPAERVTYYDIAVPQPTPVDAGPAAPEQPFPGSQTLPQRPEDAQRRGAQPGAAPSGLVFPSGVPSGIPAAPAPAAPAAGGGAGTGQPGGWASGGALRPGLRDPRLHAPAHPAPAEAAPTPHEEYMTRLGTQLGEYNDSIAVEQEAARRGLDWTVRGRNGERYGFSPGKIHLGKVTLPNPVGFAPNPAERERAERISEERRQLDRQAADAEARNSFRERVRATRARKDEERRRARGGS
ncbi:MAG TPA: hypothetical protein VHG28_17575 [Longimicrobiaceae bacterium]|nr:hypothetical protein [Longimicrobiaceae bacterium]